MLEIGALEAEHTFSALLDRVQGGEEVLITRHGEPIARLIPSIPSIDRSQAEAALDRMSQRARDARIPFDWEELKQDRDAGRP